MPQFESPDFQRAFAAVSTDGDEVDAPEDAQVLGHGGLGPAEGGDELHDVAFAGDEAVQERPAARLGDGAEGVGGGGGAGHGHIIFPYGNMSSAGMKKAFEGLGRGAREGGQEVRPDFLEKTAADHLRMRAEAPR